MALRQQQPVIPGVLDQSAARFHQPLLEKFDSADLRLCSARDEARALFVLVERGIETAAQARETIEVTPADERRICAAAAGDPVLLAPLAFRGAVLKEFDRLARQQEHRRLNRLRAEPAPPQAVEGKGQVPSEGTAALAYGRPAGISTEKKEAGLCEDRP